MNHPAFHGSTGHGPLSYRSVPIGTALFRLHAGAVAVQDHGFRARAESGAEMVRPACDDLVQGWIGCETRGHLEPPRLPIGLNQFGHRLQVIARRCNPPGEVCRAVDPSGEVAEAPTLEFGVDRPLPCIQDRSRIVAWFRRNVFLNGPERRGRCGWGMASTSWSFLSDRGAY